MHNDTIDEGVETRGTRVRKQLRAFRQAADQLQAQKLSLNTEEPARVGIDRLLERYQSLRDAEADLFSYALDSLSRKISRLESALEQVCQLKLVSG